MTLNDCFALNNTSPVYLRKNLTSFSLYGMIVSECELLQSQIKSVFFGEKGSNLFLESLEKSAQYFASFCLSTKTLISKIDQSLYP